MAERRKHSLTPPATTGFDLAAALEALPNRPGVYRMYDAKEGLLYVGKAKNLRNRVRSYFQPGTQHSPKNQRLVQHIHRFDTVVTTSEWEALVLEDNLIKEHRPPYNVLMRDDKKYPWICIPDEPFPRLTIARNVTRNKRERGKSRYYGPYTSAGDLYQTLRILKKHFPLRQRRKPLFKDRPCMNYFIGTCPGPCQQKVTAENYAETLKQVELFLKGKTPELLRRIEADMQAASEALNFEWAAKLRDRYAVVANVMQHQQRVAFSNPELNQDVVGLAADDLRCTFAVLKIRDGKLITTVHADVTLTYGATLAEALGSFLAQHYAEREPDDLPEELLLPIAPEPAEDALLLVEGLTHRRKSLMPKAKKLSLAYPQKGEKSEVLALATQNAEETLDRLKVDEGSRLRRDPASALLALQEALDLPHYPARMECYDISHVQGAYTVASMVVFTDGRPDKAEYKRFKIKTAEGKPDDFKSMAEVIGRRFKHASVLGAQAADRWDDPDLVIIDGGKGQLGAALAALEQLGVSDQPIVSLAKKFEEVFVPGQSRPVILPRDSEALFLLQQIRDEAHRFAITYHRKLRTQGTKKSLLDNIPGIGEKRKAQLLQAFKTVKVMKKATVADLEAAGLSLKQAEAVYEALRQ